MAKVNNLHVVASSTENPRKAYFSTNKNILKMSTIKKIYFNDILIWQNSNPFIFVEDINQLDIKSLDADTIIFTGFNKTKIEGTYDIMETPQDKPTERGQMVVIQTTEDDN